VSKKSVFEENEIVSLQEIHKRCAKICRRYGFQSFLYHYYHDSDPKNAKLVYGSTNPALAVQNSRGILRKLDGRLVATGVLSDTLNGFAREQGVEVKAILDESSQEDVVSNVLRLNLANERGHRSQLLLVSSTASSHKIDPSDLNQVEIYAKKIHEGVVRQLKSDCDDIGQNLSRREIECLQWASEGKTNAEISLILEISQRTVIFHLRNAAAKLNASNRQHAVSQAMIKGLVKPTITT